jgi:cytochrome c5
MIIIQRLPAIFTVCQSKRAGTFAVSNRDTRGTTVVHHFPTASGKLLVAFLVLVFSSTLFAASNDDIIARIAPAGSVCVIGAACAGGTTVTSTTGSSGAEDPTQVYNTYCVACHGSGANNAPIMGDSVAWQPRLDKGIDTLYQNAINGFNNGAMPPKGLCMGCSNETIQATVDYILSALQ